MTVHRPLYALTPVLAGLLWMGGCEDPEAARHSEVRAEIDSARVELAHAVAGTIRPGADQYDEARQKLEQVTTKLRGIDGGSRGQQGAKELLTATALQELAAMDQDAIDVMMEDINQHLASAAANTRAALMLNELAGVRANIDLTDERARLDEAGASAQRELTEVNQQLTELQDPIAEREQLNEQDRTRVAELREQAEVLYRQADVAGPADGLADFLEAQRLMREADKLERAISDRLIELDYNYAAEHAHKTDRMEALRAQLEAIGTTRSDLDSLVQTLEADAGASRAKSRELAGEARNALAEIQTLMTDELLPRYESAANHLQDAVSQAQAAAGKLERDSASTARVARARALATLGQLHLLHANAIERQQEVARQLSTLPDMQNLASRADALETQHEEAMASAIQAYTDARDAAANAGGGAEIAALQQGLNAMVAQLTGTEPPAPTSITPPDAPGAAPIPGAITPPGAAGTPPFATPEELVAFLNNVDANDPQVIDHLIAVMHAESANGRAVVRFMRTMGDFATAISEQFGAEALQQVSQDQDITPMPFDRAELIDAQEGQATARVHQEGGQSGDVTLINNNGQWMIDVDSLLEATSMTGDPAQDVAMLSAMSAPFAELTTRIRNGEFSTPEGVMAALMEAMMGGAIPPDGGPG